MNSNSSSSQKNSVSTKNNPGGTTNYFEPEGCPAVIDGRRCGETKNLQIIQEFKRLYETKMKQIDDAAGGDCVQAKINLQQEWIRDLTEQNEMLVRVVEELEVEAAERVMRLEEKLQHSAKCACEKMGHIQNDLNNLIEVLKRVKNYGLWSSRGLNFYTINIEELMNGTDGDLVQTEINRNTDCNCNCNGDTSAICKNERLLKEKDRKLKDLEEKIKKLNEIAEKNEEARRTCQQYAELKKAQEDSVLIEGLSKENTQLYEEVKLLKLHVNRMRGELSAKGIQELRALRSRRLIEPNKEIQVHKEIQTTTVSILGETSYVDMVKTKETERILVANLETEIKSMLKEMHYKDRQLYDQSELISLLVQKLFCVYKTLRRVDDETTVMVEDLENSCHCEDDDCAEKYQEIITIFQNGLRKSISGIEDRTS